MGFVPPLILCPPYRVDLDNLPELDDLAAEIIENLEAGLACFREIVTAL
jgi:hypothetical protein